MTISNGFGTILALDLATQYGWAEGEPDGTPRFGSARLAREGAEQEDIFAGAIREIGGRIAAFPPRVMVFEEPELFRLRDGKATKRTIEVLFGLPAVVQGVARRFGVPTIYKATTYDIRKHFIGQGRLQRSKAKIAVIEECHRRGWEVRNDDEADACALWSYTCAVVAPQLRVNGPGTPLFRAGS